MPGKDGTGPAMYGEFGCRNANITNSSRRMLAPSRFINISRPYGCFYASSKEALAAEKELLERRLAQVNESLK